MHAMHAASQPWAVRRAQVLGEESKKQHEDKYNHERSVYARPLARPTARPPDRPTACAEYPQSTPQSTRSAAEYSADASCRI